MNNLQKARIKNMDCLFTPLRVNLDTDNIYTYELQTEDGFTPTILKKRILVNHFGTILIKNEIELKDGYLELEEDELKAVDKNGIRIIYPNGIIYEINTEQVYSNRKVFSMNVEQCLKAINLTVEYLKNRQIIESAKATK